MKRESISNSTENRHSSLSEGRLKNKTRERSSDNNDSKTIKGKFGEPLLTHPSDHNAHTQSFDIAMPKSHKNLNKKENLLSNLQKQVLEN